VIYCSRFNIIRIMSGQNVYFDVAVGNSPMGRITFKVKLTNFAVKG
jgi:hypothetical protein